MRPLPGTVFAGLVVGNVLVRILLGLQPGYVWDVQPYKEWALVSAVRGLNEAYESSSIDYPPLFLYVLWVVGKLYMFVHPPSASGVLTDSTTLTLLVKSPALLFDLALAGLLGWLVAVGRLWGDARAGAGWGRLAALFYLWNPAVLWGAGYWGQPDGVHSVLALASLTLLGAGRMIGSGALLAAAGLMKPLAAPIVPLVAAAVALRRGVGGLLRLTLGGLAVGLLAFLPFLSAGRIVPVLQKVLVDLDAMPFASVHAHNLWWLIGASRDANAPVLGPLNLKSLGLALFGGVALLLLVRSRGWLRSIEDPLATQRARLFALGAALVAAFFFLATHMHENHLFMVLPLLLALAGRHRAFAWLAIAATLAVFLNMALHDLAWPHALPGPLGAPSPWIDPHFGRPYTWLQMVGAAANTLLVACVALGTFLAAWRDLAGGGGVAARAGLRP